MKYLFIGGLKDAERIEVPDGQDYYRTVEAVGSNWDDCIAPFSDNPHVNITEHVYKKHGFYGMNGDMWYAFLYKDIDAIEMLLNGYRKGKRRNKKNKLY